MVRLGVFTLLLFFTCAPVAAAADVTGLWYARASCRASVLNLLPDKTFRLLYYDAVRPQTLGLEIVRGTWWRRGSHLVLTYSEPPKFLPWRWVEFGFKLTDSRAVTAAVRLRRQQVLRSPYERSAFAYFSREVDVECVHPVLSSLPDFVE